MGKEADQSRFYINKDITRKLNTETRLSFKSNVVNIETKMNKARLIGYDVRSLDEDTYAVRFKDTLTIYSSHQIALPINCYRLFSDTMFKEIDMHGLDASEVKYMMGTFQNMHNLEKLDMSNLKIPKLISLDSVFYDTISNVVDMSGMYIPKARKLFQTFICAQINKLDMSNIDASHMYEIWGIFASLKSKTVDLSNFKIREDCRLVEVFDESRIETIKITDKNLLKEYEAYHK